MWRLTRRHPDDEALIAHLDGELRSRADRRIAAHARSCWQCRTRLAQIEEQVRQLTEARNRRVAAARRLEPGQSFRMKFDALADEAGRSTAAPRLTLSAPRWSVAAPLAAALVVLLVGVFFWWRSGTVPGPRAPEALAATQAFEQRLFDSTVPVHQVFRVEASSGGGTRDVSRLEIWSDPGARRYASKWSGDAGVLRCAVWRPGSGQEFTYFREAGSSAARLGQAAYLADVGSAGLDRFQEEFFAWLNHNRWRPVSLSSELSHLVGRDGASLRVERIETAHGAVLRLTARRQAREAVLEVDEATHRPRSLTLRYRSGGRDLSLRLISETLESTPAALVPASAFRPDIPLPGTPIETPDIAKAERPRPALSEADLDAAEVRVLYALHHGKACAEDQVELVRQDTGIEVRAQASSAERKRALLAALAGIPNAIPRIQAPGETPRASAAPAQVRPIEVRVERSAIADRLEEYLKDSAAGDVRLKAGEVSDEAVSTAQAALSHAWGLRRLAEWAKPEKMDRLTPDSKRLLAAMIRDHANLLRERIAREASTVAPVLASFAGPVADASSTGAQPEDWQGASLALFEQVDRMERLTLSLFARSGAGGAETVEAARSLLAALERAQGVAKALESRVEAEFPRGEAVSASRPAK